MLVSPLARAVAARLRDGASLEMLVHDLDLPPERVQIALDELEQRGMLSVNEDGNFCLAGATDG